MKPGRAFKLLTGVALLCAIARFNEMTPDANASLLDAGAETARGTSQSLQPSAVVTSQAVTGKATVAATQERLEHVGAPPQAEDREGAAVPSQRTGARSANPGPHAPANPLWAVPLKQLSVTGERPIFSPSRRPAPPTPTNVAPVAVRQPAKPPELERPAVSLVGTVIGTNVRIAVFLETATRNVVHLRVGEDHQGWVLRLVKAREVTLVKDVEQTVVLELPPPGEPVPPGGPTMPPPVPNSIGTVPIVSNASYVDEQPIPAKGGR